MGTVPNPPSRSVTSPNGDRPREPVWTQNLSAVSGRLYVREMARQPRKQPEAEFHHITNRGARRSDIYLDDWDRQTFLELLEGAHERYGSLVHAYALLGNHYHLIIQFPQRNMPKVMHWVGTCFTQKINRKYGYDGRLCKDRYFNSPIEDGDYFLTAARYVHRNPLDVGEKDLVGYNWSNFSDYVGTSEPPTWTRTDLVLGQFGNKPEVYRRFVELTLATDLRDLAS